MELEKYHVASGNGEKATAVIHQNRLQADNLKGDSFQLCCLLANRDLHVLRDNLKG